MFDKSGHLWVVTDISSSRLNGANEYAYHKNNAMFMVPTEGPNKGIGFRFANGPVHCELTGPYFTPDEETLFVNVQHPGEQTGNSSTAPGVFGLEDTYTSWWPEGNKTAGDNPSMPKPSTIAITRRKRGQEDAGDRFVSLAADAQAENAILVTTEKDWVRLSPRWCEKIRALKVTLHWDDDAALERVLMPALETAHG